MARNGGWYKEPERHAAAARGIKTAHGGVKIRDLARIGETKLGDVMRRMAVINASNRIIEAVRWAETLRLRSDRAKAVQGIQVFLEEIFWAIEGIQTEEALHVWLSAQKIHNALPAYVQDYPGVDIKIRRAASEMRTIAENA